MALIAASVPELDEAHALDGRHGIGDQLGQLDLVPVRRAVAGAARGGIA